MDKRKLKRLLVSIIKWITLLPLLFVSYISVDNVEIVLKSVDEYQEKCVFNKYGLYRRCARGCEEPDSKYKCTILSFHPFIDVGPLQYMIYTLGFALFACLPVVYSTVAPFTNKPKIQKYSLHMDLLLGFCVLVTLICGSLQTKAIEDYWQGLNNVEYIDGSRLETTVKISNAFYVHVASCCFTIMAALLSGVYFGFSKSNGINNYERFGDNDDAIGAASMNMRPEAETLEHGREDFPARMQLENQ